MAKGFTLSIYPWVYIAQHDKDASWTETYTEKPHKTAEEEAALTDEQAGRIIQQRNSFPELPLVNYTTQYGMGCFEGLKAFPQLNGGLKLFRPDMNAARFHRSMEGLDMPAYPVEHFVNAVTEVVKRNEAIGFAPAFDKSWEKDDYVSGHSVYIRPFTYAEPGIGLNLSVKPWVVIVTTPVGSYFRPGNSKAVTTEMIRAFPGGTGWIKCDANYVIATLAKKRSEKAGYMEAIFLDAAEKKYIEEGSSCNIFFLLKSGTLVTPDLGDTVLPGITRDSIMVLARDMGLPVEERKIDIDEAMSESREVFVTGTAAGIAPFESITHGDRTAVFNKGDIGDVSHQLLKQLKGIQYGLIEDTHGWMYPV